MGRGAIPMELCQVLPGQLMRKQFPEDKTNDMVDFARKRPAERLSAIKEGLKVSSIGITFFVSTLTLLFRYFNMVRVTMFEGLDWMSARHRSRSRHGFSHPPPSDMVEEGRKPLS